MVTISRKLWLVTQEPKRRMSDIYKSTVVVVEAENKKQAIELADIVRHLGVSGDFKKVNAVPLQLNAKYVL
jgi:hypothetical protein